MTELQQKFLDAIRRGPCDFYTSMVRANANVPWWDAKEAVEALESMGLVEHYQDRIYTMLRVKEVTSDAST